MTRKTSRERTAALRKRAEATGGRSVGVTLSPAAAAALERLMDTYVEGPKAAIERALLQAK